jgi:hypothetical protein
MAMVRGQPDFQKLVAETRARLEASTHTCRRTSSRRRWPEGLKTWFLSDCRWPSVTPREASIELGTSALPSESCRECCNAVDGKSVPAADVSECSIMRIQILR